MFVLPERRPGPCELQAALARYLRVFFESLTRLARKWAPGVSFPVLLLLTTTSASASLDPNLPLRQYVLRTWQTAQGLPQSSVLALAQTPEGYLWLGTEEGLVRFDGIRFTTYEGHQTGIQGQIKALLVDHDRNLWIGSNGSLSRLRQGRFTTYSTRDGLPGQAILSLHEDPRGAVWAGTDGGGLIRIENGKFRVFTSKDGLPNDVVFSITDDRKGHLWVGTREGLGRFSQGRFEAVGREAGLGKLRVRCLQFSQNGDLWAGTDDGLYRMRASLSDITRFTVRDGLTSNAIFSLYQDSRAAIWIGTLSGGLNRFVNGRFTSLTESDGLAGKDVWSLLEDREGDLWAGTAGGGLNCLRQGSFTSLTKEDGLISDLVLATFQDSEGTTWIGSDKGLERIKNGQSKIYTTAQGLPSNYVFSVAEGPDHAIWIGTREGLARLDNEHITVFKGQIHALSDFIASIYTDRNGTVWIGTRSGLVRFDGRQFRTFTTLDGLSNNFVIALYGDPQGVLWIGTNGGGLCSLNNGSFHSYTTRDGLSNNVVWALEGIGDGTLWIGTSGGGLDRLRDGKFTTYDSAKGLFDDSPAAILDDRLGHLWLTSDRGVFSVDKEQLQALADGEGQTVKSVVYGTADGMKSRECNGGFQPAAWRTKAGLFLIPTTKGLTMVDPAHLVIDRVRPYAVIEDASVDNKHIPLGKPFTSPPGNGQLEFQFTAPSFVNPNKVEFRYMLEGFDRDWIQAGQRRVAYYTNIPHGEYRFRVKAGNGNLWSTNNASVSITLEPHFYETWLFNLILLIVVLSLFAAAYRLRVTQLKARERKLVVLVNERTFALQESEQQLRRSRDELEQRVQERTSELVDTNKALEEEVTTRRRTEEQLRLAKDAAEAASRAKSDFLANMSHEIRTPINGILGMTDITLSTELDDEQRDYLEIVRLSADSLLSIVNDILDFSKMEASKLVLDLRPFELRKSVEDLVRSLVSRAQLKDLFLTCEIADDVPNDVVGDPFRLRQVLLNLIDNGLKFTREGGVSVAVRVEHLTGLKALIHFSVTDTGIGIAPDKQTRIFEAFSQADTSSTREYGGTGLGLTISSQLVKMMGGRIRVESELGKGSTFHFTALLEIRSADVPALYSEENSLVV